MGQIDDDSAMMALVKQIKQIRSSAEGKSMTSVAVFNQLHQDQAFKASGCTLAQVKKADKKLSEMPEDEEASETEYLDGTNEMVEDQRETFADSCRVHGDGLREATVRQAAYFWIEAADIEGNKRTSGGDVFFVAIRGPAQTRARVTDNGDGTYLVIWKPHVSGVYSISISHFGIALPNTPFTCHATPTLPCPSNCIVRGDHLNNAVSRATHYFEVLFKDKLGQVRQLPSYRVLIQPQFG